MDVGDGETMKSNKSEMDMNYDVKTNHLVIKPTKINIMMSMFYDGIKISKSRKHCNSFWPVLLTILNLPPTYRNRPGIGMHLMSIYVGKDECVISDFLFRELFVQELRRLNDGIIMEMVQPNGIPKLYFIQVRIIGFVLDTPAVQEVACVQTNNSYMGCGLCDSGTGIRRSHFDKTIYVGT
jgi:hypothetical protein